ncbi:protein of unknown function [Rhodovastum atsumiense]|nr:protein of unknown function [Rhodovastum atsumiense]
MAGDRRAGPRHPGRPQAALCRAQARHHLHPLPGTTHPFPGNRDRRHRTIVGAHTPAVPAGGGGRGAEHRGADGSRAHGAAVRPAHRHRAHRQLQDPAGARSRHAGGEPVPAGQPARRRHRCRHDHRRRRSHRGPSARRRGALEGSGQGHQRGGTGARLAGDANGGLRAGSSRHARRAKPGRALDPIRMAGVGSHATAFYGAPDAQVIPPPPLARPDRRVRRNGLERPLPAAADQIPPPAFRRRHQPGANLGIVAPRPCRRPAAL